MSANQILVVEDERIVAAGIKNDLEDFGHHVTGIAASAEEAIEMAVQDQPELVLMDIHLDGEKDGIEAAREIHARCGIPVVYLSAFANAETIARAKETNAYGYLLKPYEEWELLTTIEMALATHRAEQRLAETQRWLAAILEGIDDAVIAIDAGNQIHFMNRAGHAMTGWYKEEIVGTSMATVCHLEDQRGRIALDELADGAVREGSVVELPSTTRLVDKNGVETPVEGSLSSIYDHRGKSLGTVLTMRSIRARVELERVRQRSEDQARQSQKQEAVRRMAGGVGHHLNDLLTVIRGNTSLARAEPSCDDKIAKALESVDAASHRAAAQIERLLLFSGRGHKQFPQVDLNQVLSDCLNEVTPLLASEIYAGFRPGSDLWPAIVDEIQVDQVLLNLCLNSQGAMPYGGQLNLESENVTLTIDDVAQRTGARSGDFVRVRISHDGREQAPEVPRGSLEPNFTSQAHGQDFELGIAFAAAVMEQHQGWIECTSEVGLGTWYDLYFPRFGMESLEETVRPEKPSGTRPLILLAESDAMLRSFGRLILEEEGYQVLVAEDGVQAVTIFQHSPEHIDLVIIDLNLSRLTGDAVLKRLLELDPHVEVLFSSGYFAADHYERGGHLLGIIRKPYSRQKLLEMVQLALAQHNESVSHCGRIAKICLPESPDPEEQGYGFISTCDGRELFFDADSLMGVEFQRLELESEVHFDEVQGADGPQAVSVRLVGQQHHLVA